jgi:hypothetical protein
VAGQPHPARKGADAPGPHEAPSSINRQGELKENLVKQRHPFFANRQSKVPTDQVMNPLDSKIEGKLVPLNSWNNQGTQTLHAKYRKIRF